MGRILTDEELTHLTEKRLQNLLKVARARMSAAMHCHCGCKQPLSEIYELTDEQKSEMDKLSDYVTAVKTALKNIQSPRNNHVKG